MTSSTPLACLQKAEFTSYSFFVRTCVILLRNTEIWNKHNNSKHSDFKMVWLSHSNIITKANSGHMCCEECTLGIATENFMVTHYLCYKWGKFWLSLHFTPCPNYVTVNELGFNEKCAYTIADPLPDCK